MSGHISAKRSHCQNCGSPLTGPYCPECGQHDVDYHRSIGPVVEDALEGFLHFDGKFFKTVQYIFTRPGFLTAEFIAGRRVRYTHPVRFYIFASFLYFAVHSLIGPPPTTAEAAAQEQAAGPGAAAADTGPSAKPADHSRLAAAFQRDFGLDGKMDRKAVSREIGHLVPSMLFLCLPLLAALLKLAYRSGGRYYIEHLIFALHVQALVFLAALADELSELLLRAAGVRDPSIVGFLTFCAAAFLVYRSVRVVYGQGRMGTLMKMALVGGAYGMILLAGVVMVAMASAFMVAHGA